MEQGAPEGLHAREYAMQILESLGWPNDRGQSSNLILISECLTALTKCDKFKPKLTLTQAHGYMERAIRLAREQYVTVDRFFFRDGAYMHMRPVQKLPQYKPVDRKRTEQEQSTPEFEALRRKMDDLLRKLSGQVQMPEAK